MSKSEPQATLLLFIGAYGDDRFNCRSRAITVRRRTYYERIEVI